MKVEIGTKFKIGYKAKKHNDEFIWREGMWTEGCGLWTAKNGKTILIVTHEEDTAKMCSRIVRLKDGIIVEDKKNKMQKAI